MYWIKSCMRNLSWRVLQIVRDIIEKTFLIISSGQKMVIDWLNKNTSEASLVPWSSEISSHTATLVPCGSAINTFPLESDVKPRSWSTAKIQNSTAIHTNKSFEIYICPQCGVTNGLLVKRISLNPDNAWNTFFYFSFGKPYGLGLNLVKDVFWLHPVYLYQHCLLKINASSLFSALSSLIYPLLAGLYSWNIVGFICSQLSYQFWIWSL